MPDCDPKIVILDGYTTNPGDLDFSRLAGLGDLTVYDRTDDRDVLDRIGDAQIVLTNKTLLNARTLREAPQLEYVGVLATGYNVIDIDAAAEEGVTVTNVPGYSTDSVAQHVFALLLELCNRTAEHDAAVHDGQWVTSEDFSFTTGPLVELAGKKLGIVGVGDIGRRVATIGHALGMKVLAAHQSSMNEVNLPGIDIEWMPHDDLFARADVVTLHCPLTPETEGMVSQERLASMKETAFLINTGRGPLVDQQALADALIGSSLAGAGLDVLSNEPPEPANPLLSAPRCVITPHIAWATAEARQRLIDIASDNVAAFLNDEPTNVIAGPRK
ncbi:MAG: D-2-hydroxyacid dehydrogenase [Phycisphaeraceae bacterium]|nr:D-2-hydroxyacid dehydrogenase [Phycisphaeraceae bacterium]